MPIQSVIFDLDQTLVDSSALEAFRRAQLWDAVLSQLGQVTLYEGIAELWQQCRAANLRIAVVTASPRPICEAILAQFGLVADAIVAAGESRFPKPSRDPVLAALREIGRGAYSTVVIGDRCVDIVSGHKANARYTIGANWGTQDARALLLSNPTYVANTVEEARHLIAGLIVPDQHAQWLLQKQREANNNFQTQLWIDDSNDVPRGYLGCGNFPYYYCRNRFRGIWSVSYANMLVKNMKFVGLQTDLRHKFKLESCDQMATELGHLHRRLNLPNLTISFIPGSKGRDHPEFDPRFDFVGGYLRQAGFPVVQPIITATSHDAVHSDEGTYENRAPDVIRAHLGWQGFGDNIPANVLLVDDVITSGGHFRACVEVIREHHPDVNVIGAFWTAHLGE